MLEFRRILSSKKVFVPVVLNILIISIFSVIYFSNTAYAVKIDGKEIGVVKNKEELYTAIQEIENSIKDELGTETKISQAITSEKIFKLAAEITPMDVIKSRLQENLEVKVEAYSLNVDGEDLVYLKDRESAEEILNRIKSQYLQDKNNKEISFVEKVEILRRDVEAAKIKDLESAYQYIVEGSSKPEKYVIKEGDTTWDITKKHNITLDEIKQANPGINLDSLQIGQELNLVAPKPFINVKVVETIAYEKDIAYDTKYQETENLYLGERKIQTKGKEGKKKVVEQVVKVNNILTDRNVIKEEIVQQPQTEIILKGTKKRPQTVAYGIFRNPASGPLTSRFGPRWGERHTGIDIAAPFGAPVVAADGGKVIYSGFKSDSGYGNLIIIDHENGYKTYYAHNNTLKVKVGERVYKGQVIATVGATGRVTGPHLHFEVRKNDQPVNPLQFIRN